MIKAIIFDLDGVLVKTELQTFKFYQEQLKRIGITLKDEDFKFKAGRKSKDFFNDVLSSEQKKIVSPEELTTLKRILFRQDPDQFLEKVEGLDDLLDRIKQTELQMAVASQNEPEMINAVINWLGIKNYFPLILSIKDIKKLKPNPEIYNLAVSKLGLKTNECVVVEDSEDGVNAARNANIKCVGIRHPYTPLKALVKADLIVDSLNEITIKKLLAL